MSAPNYAVVIAPLSADDGADFLTPAPNPPAYVSVGATLDEVQAEIAEAIAFPIEGMREDGLPVPQPSAPTSSTPPSRPPDWS
jgi:predicted RNase H-like HicB family nuclease